MATSTDYGEGSLRGNSNHVDSMIRMTMDVDAIARLRAKRRKTDDMDYARFARRLGRRRKIGWILTILFVIWLFTL